NVAQRKNLKPYGLRIVEEDRDPFFYLELHPVENDDESGFVKTYKNVRTGRNHLKALLEHFNLHEVLRMERKGPSIFMRNGHISESEKHLWEDQFRKLKTTLHDRERFHCVVIDDSFSHHQAMCFVFQKGFLVKKGMIDVEEVWSDQQLGNLEDHHLPNSMNDQIIAFIEKYQHRYKILKLQRERIL